MDVKRAIRRPRVEGGEAAAEPGLNYTQSVNATLKKQNIPGHAGFSWMGTIWLVYSVFFLIDPLQRHDLRHWVALVIVYPVFLAVYFSFYIADTGVRQGSLSVLSMFLLGLAYLPVNLSSGGIVIYAAAYLPFLFESATLILTLLAVGSVLLAVEAYLLHFMFWTWVPTIGISFIVGVSNLTVARQKRADRKLRMAHEEIEHLAKVAERERIARDLHDVLGHTLSVIVLKSELAGRLIDRDPERMAREIADVEQIARKALAEVREAIGGYRSEGLVSEIERAHRTLEAAGVDLHCQSTPPKLSPAEETVLSLVLREAVTNIVRHARARQCHLTFAKADGYHTVAISDNGGGGRHVEGNGLRGMRERIEALGGRFAVDAAIGTRLIIQLPVEQAAALELTTPTVVHELAADSVRPSSPVREIAASR